jgi:hypothetical protein
MVIYIEATGEEAELEETTDSKIHRFIPAIEDGGLPPQDRSMLARLLEWLLLVWIL